MLNCIHINKYSMHVSIAHFFYFPHYSVGLFPETSFLCVHEGSYIFFCYQVLHLVFDEVLTCGHPHVLLEYCQKKRYREIYVYFIAVSFCSALPSLYVYVFSDLTSPYFISHSSSMFLYIYLLLAG